MEKANLFTLKQFAEYLGISEPKARDIMAGLNHPPAVRFGRRWSIPREGVDTWLTEVTKSRKVLSL